MVHDQPVHAVVDTAADVTVVSERFFRSLTDSPGIKESATLRAAAEGQFFRADISRPVVIKVGTTVLTRSVYVAPIKDNMLLGIDILNELKARIDLGNHTMEVAGEVIKFKDESNDGPRDGTPVTDESTEVYLDRALSVPPGSEVVARVEIPKSSRGHSRLLFEPAPGLPVLVPSCMTSGSTSMAVSFTNVGHRFIKLKKGTELGIVQPVEDVSDRPSVRKISCPPGSSDDILPEKLQKMYQDAESSAGEDMSEDQRKRLRSLLIEFQDVFVKDDFDLGGFSALEHHIDTGDAAPVRLGLRRTPIHHVE